MVGSFEHSINICSFLLVRLLLSNKIILNYVAVVATAGFVTPVMKMTRQLPGSSLVSAGVLPSGSVPLLSS